MTLATASDIARDQINVTKKGRNNEKHRHLVTFKVSVQNVCDDEESDGEDSDNEDEGDKSNDK